MKIDCQNLKELKVLSTINHELGYSTNITFDHNDWHFICGGDQSNDLKIYNLKTMNVVATIDNHN
jgi:WD40 repeat protein